MVVLPAPGKPVTITQPDNESQVYQGCRAIHVLSLGSQGDSVTRRASDPARQLARILNS
jgi:hypothetical protein